MESTFSVPKQGSPILAYGFAKRPFGFFRSRILLAAIILGICLVGAVLFFALGRIALPKNQALLIALQPQLVSEKLTGDLIADLPSPWRTAIQTKSRSVAYLGIAKNEDGSFYAFSVIPRFVAIAPASGAHVEKLGIYRLVTDAKKTEFESTRLWDLMSLGRKIQKNDAAWIMHSDLFGAMLDSNASSDKTNSVIFGTWKGLTGEIQIPASSLGVQMSDSSQIQAALEENRIEADPAIQALLAEGIDLRAISKAPTDIRLDQNGDLHLGWDTLPREDRPIVLAAFGLTDTRSFKLPDGEIKEIIASTSTDDVSGEASPFRISKNGVETEFPDPSDGSTEPCTGSLKLMIQGQALRNTLGMLNFPSSWQEYLTSFQIRENKGISIICTDIRKN